MLGGVRSSTLTVPKQESDPPRPPVSVAVSLTRVSPRLYGPGGSWASVKASQSESEVPSSMETAAVQVGPAAAVTLRHPASGGSFKMWAANRSPPRETSTWGDSQAPGKVRGRSKTESAALSPEPGQV